MKLCLLLALVLLAGCTNEAADAVVAPAAEIATAEEPVFAGVALDPLVGEFLLATNVPAQDPPCEEVGTVFSPEPGPGEWREWTLPPETARVEGELLTDGRKKLSLAFRLCFFVEDKLLAGFTATRELPFEVEVPPNATLRVLVAPASNDHIALNLGRGAKWSVEGVAFTGAREGPA